MPQTRQTLLKLNEVISCLPLQTLLEDYLQVHKVQCNQLYHKQYLIVSVAEAGSSCISRSLEDTIEVFTATSLF